MDESHGIGRLLDEIEQARDLGLCYVAMLGIVSVPDLMAALEHESGRTNGARYREWYSANVVSELGAEDAWALRCSLLHEARSSTASEGTTAVSRIAFAEPTTAGTLRTGYMAGSVMLVHVPDLCDAVVTAARTWIEANALNPVVTANLNRTLRRGSAVHVTQGRQINADVTMVMST